MACQVGIEEDVVDANPECEDITVASLVLFEVAFNLLICRRDWNSRIWPLKCSEE